MYWLKSEFRFALHGEGAALRQAQGGGGGGEEYSHFFLIRRLGPSINCLQIKYQEYQAYPQKIYLKFINLQKVFEFCSLALRKSSKMFISDP